MKKIFAVLMIAMMCVCFMPAAAFGDEEAVAMIGEVTYTTLDAAVEKATDGETIHLLKDCTTAGLNLNKNLTIDGSTGDVFNTMIVSLLVFSSAREASIGSNARTKSACPL